MADDLNDLFTYTLGLGLVIMGLMIGIFNQAGIGPAMTAPQVTYGEDYLITLTAPDSGTSAGLGEQANSIATGGFMALIFGIKTMLLDFVPYCDKFGVPAIISVPAQALIWLIAGYDLLKIKRVIWG